MNWSLLTAIVWVFAATVTATLPMRRQYPPGITLLVLAPFLIGWLAYDYGLWIGVLGVLAFASMFRNPLIYFVKKALGMPVSLPPDDSAPEDRR